MPVKSRKPKQRPTVQDAIDFFATYYEEERSITQRTKQNYMKNLEWFRRWCFDNDIRYLTQVGTDAMREYKRYCLTLGLAKDARYGPRRPNQKISVDHKIRHLRVVFGWLVRQGWMESDPTEGMEYSGEHKRKREQMRPFTQPQVKAMLRYLKEWRRYRSEFLSRRNIALHRVLLGTGIRIGGLCSLRWDRMNLKEGWAVVFEKGEKERTIHLHPTLRMELADWKSYCQQYFARKDMDMPQHVWTSERGRPLTPDAAGSHFSQLQQKLKKLHPDLFGKVRISAHTYRVTLASDLARKGAPLRTVQAVLGHEDESTSLIYVKKFGKDIQEQADRYNPINDV